MDKKVFWLNIVNTVVDTLDDEPICCFTLKIE